MLFKGVTLNFQSSKWLWAVEEGSNDTFVVGDFDRTLYLPDFRRW
jgi:hypothetical protein